ncbi:MAG: zf-HC2 domain-containing protein [candidate division Zixibacteria bacterium]|nr:zf-HC2 domain-containing protein [candidate division Zixibacteria bacterium]
MYFKSLVDDLVDHELPPALETTVREHLGVCPVCRGEYVRSARLKAVLSELVCPEPEPGYWQESAALIRARTIDSTGIIDVTTEIERRSQVRKSFYRSLAAVAASLILFFGSLMIDSPWGASVPVTTSVPAADIALSASTTEAREMGGGYILEDEQALIARSVLLVGTPGMAFNQSGLLAAMGTNQKR